MPLALDVKREHGPPIGLAGGVVSHMFKQGEPNNGNSSGEDDNGSDVDSEAEPEDNDYETENVQTARRVSTKSSHNGSSSSAISSSSSSSSNKLTLNARTSRR